MEKRQVHKPCLKDYDHHRDDDDDDDDDDVASYLTSRIVTRQTQREIPNRALFDASFTRILRQSSTCFHRLPSFCIHEHISFPQNSL